MSFRFVIKENGEEVGSFDGINEISTNEHISLTEIEESGKIDYIDYGLNRSDLQALNHSKTRISNQTDEKLTNTAISIIYIAVITGSLLIGGSFALAAWNGSWTFQHCEQSIKSLLWLATTFLGYLILRKR